MLNHKSLIIITKWCSASRPNKSIWHRERGAAKIITFCIKIIEITNFHHAAPATILNCLNFYAMHTTLVSGQSGGSEFQTSIASRLASLFQCITLISLLQEHACPTALAPVLTKSPRPIHTPQANSLSNHRWCIWSLSNRAHWVSAEDTKPEVKQSRRTKGEPAGPPARNPDSEDP